MLPEFLKELPMKTAFLAAILLVSLALPADARTIDPSPTPEPILTAEATQTAIPALSATPTPVAKISKSVGEGYFGLGLNSISVSPHYGLIGAADSVNLFSLRYWLTDQFILEALVGGTAGTQVGQDAYGNLVNDPYWAYCWGFGVKTNVLEPFDGLMVQTITRIMNLQNSSQNSNNAYVYTDQFQYLSVQAGLGFEYFMPFVKNLSVETSVYLEFDDNWENYSNNPRNPAITPTLYNPSTWIFKVNSPGFNLTSVSIHYYF